MLGKNDTVAVETRSFDLVLGKYSMQNIFVLHPIKQQRNEEIYMNTKICEQCEWYKAEGNCKDIHGKEFVKRICMRLVCPLDKD